MPVSGRGKAIATATATSTATATVTATAAATAEAAAAAAGEVAAAVAAATATATAAFEENDRATPQGKYRAAQGTNGNNGKVERGKVPEGSGAGSDRGVGRVRRGKGDGCSGSGNVHRGTAVSTSFNNSSSGAFVVNSPPRPRRASCGTAGVSERLYSKNPRPKPTAAGNSFDNAGSDSEGVLVESGNP